MTQKSAFLGYLLLEGWNPSSKMDLEDTRVQFPWYHVTFSKIILTSLPTYSVTYLFPYLLTYLHTYFTYIHTYLLTYSLTHLLTYAMEQSPSWEVNWFSVSQEFPRILCKPNVHHKCLHPVPILSQNISPGPRLSMWTFPNMIHFYGEELLVPRPTPKLEDHPISASATAYSIYSQLPSVLEAVPPSAACGLAMPWWRTHISWIP